MHKEKKPTTLLQLTRKKHRMQRLAAWCTVIFFVCGCTAMLTVTAIQTPPRFIQHLNLFWSGKQNGVFQHTAVRNPGSSLPLLQVSRMN
ncbi:MAG: hypothetical protein LBQ33_02510 [Oscillospiraceae bacterium]|nr:hypothetical protein [Oscillospiraceae bacterium]